LGIGIKVISDEEDSMTRKYEPLAIVLKRPLEWGHVVHTDDMNYLNTIFAGNYPSEEVKTISLNEPLPGDSSDGSSAEKIELLRSLSKSNNFHTTPRGALGNSGYVIKINTGYGKEADHPYIYFPQTGEWGHGEEWYDVPLEFRQWIKTLKPEPSVPVPTPNR
jgi:hypothetical protein